MKEIGIMFSAPMVRAVDSDRKTVTRRLASSPLARLKPGTILWVRETFRFDVAYDEDKPSKAPTAAAVWYEADNHVRGGGVPGKLRPAIHMPRFASRIGLKLEALRIEPLQTISYSDAVAEGIEREGEGWKSYETYPDGTRHPHAIVPNLSPITSYRELWCSLHGAESWTVNPDVVVLTFSKAWVDK